MSFNYNHAKHLLGLGDLELDTMTLEILLLTASSDAGTQDDVTSVSNFTNLFEHTHGSYTRQTIAPASSAWTKDVTNNRSELVPTINSVFSALQQATDGDVIACLIGVQTGTLGVDTTLIPLRYVDDGGFPKTATGQDFTIDWHDTDGLFWIA